LAQQVEHAVGEYSQLLKLQEEREVLVVQETEESFRAEIAALLIQ
jgi:hypothetical protein